MKKYFILLVSLCAGFILNAQTPENGNIKFQAIGDNSVYGSTYVEGCARVNVDYDAIVDTAIAYRMDLIKPVFNIGFPGYLEIDDQTTVEIAIGSIFIDSIKIPDAHNVNVHLRQDTFMYKNDNIVVKVNNLVATEGTGSFHFVEISQSQQDGKLGDNRIQQDITVKADPFTSWSATGACTTDGALLVGSVSGATIEWQGPNNYSSNTAISTLTGTDYNGTYNFIGTVTDVPQCKDTIAVDIQCSSLLPVEYLYFKAVKNNIDADLTWSTATETENERFDIERSFDGVRFVKVGEVEGNGTTTDVSTYSYTDREVAYQVTNTYVYYRLKQVDYNGNFEYSEIRQLAYDNVDATETVLYPNPVHNYVSVKMNKPCEDCTLDILNYNGQIVKSDAFASGQRINLETLPAGMYLVKIRNASNQEVAVKRMIKTVE